eukprot:6315803-Alexandrium_andersonii.AAC.1
MFVPDNGRGPTRTSQAWQMCLASCSEGSFYTSKSSSRASFCSMFLGATRPADILNERAACARTRAVVGGPPQASSGTPC